ncbi:hypothetical protein Pcinc_023998 [Petrolisthes cinctipes]|uniref:Peptidase M14 domain-containing protein n=1 Tax=Petrolisthes cinctipes TaxID=88211 RepID=A0AAE1KF13_PETCI|nr:hypothetical protein Pcinc_023998 [Petrolisthes cinctipes]
MKVLLVLCGLVLVVSARPDPHPHLKGAQVLRVVPEETWQVGYLRALQQQDLYDFWTEPNSVGRPVDMMSDVFQLPVLRAALENVNLSPRVLVSDVASLVAGSTPHQHNNKDSFSTRIDWTDYYDYDQITGWLDSLATDYPSVCKTEDVGTTYEGRTMKLITIGTGAADNPGIFIDGGIHAREWISPATVTYMINELVTKGSGEFSELLSKVNFYVMPSINPDGYQYTWTNDRLWRKTRSDTDSSFGCKGVDPNRNWGFHWNEVGASSSPCSDIYAGPEPFSEVEMQVVRDQVNRFAPTLQAYLTFHSYSQLWMYPWGFTSDLPDDWQDMDNLAQNAVTALTSLYGTRYEIGSSTNTIYAAAGGSDDWVKGVAGVKYAYTVELRDTGSYGFLLPTNQIIPTAEETFEGVKVVADFIMNNNGR